MLKLDKIYCMDCIEGMKQMPDDSVDLIVADPPFGINHKGADWDNINFKDLMIKIDREFMRLLKDGGRYFCFVSLKEILKVGSYIDDIALYVNLLTFSRYNQHTGMYNSIQPLIVKPKGKPKRISSPCHGWLSYFITNASNTSKKNKNNIRNLNHPSPKCVNSIHKIVNSFSNKNDIVLDPFMGIGTTAIACKMINRHFIGFEIEKKYCDIANKRLKDCTTIDKWM